jgi:flavoprotein
VSPVSAVEGCEMSDKYDPMEAVWEGRQVEKAVKKMNAQTAKTMNE